MTLTEAKTRQRYIDSQLAEAGWGIDERSVLEEFELGTKEGGTSEYGEKPSALKKTDPLVLRILDPLHAQW